MSQSDEIGVLMVEVWQARHELERLRECGTEMAAQLRVVADCLDTNEKASVTGFPSEHVFSSDHSSDAYLRGQAVISGPHHSFAIPQNVESLMCRIHELEEQIRIHQDSLDQYEREITVQH